MDIKLKDNMLYDKKRNKLLKHTMSFENKCFALKGKSTMSFVEADVVNFSEHALSIQNPENFGDVVVLLIVSVPQTI